MTHPKLQLADALGHEVADKRLEILRRIGEQGSISEAARGAGVSYKAAWQAIDTLSNLAGAALLERTVGGTGGGGARLTAAGKQLLQAADLLNSARLHVLAQMAEATETQTKAHSDSPRFAALTLRTSMRNQLPCVVKALKNRGQAVRVELSFPDGTPLFSRITKESAELLGLHPGQEVLALCKATAVRISQTEDRSGDSNFLAGRVKRASRAVAGGEVAIELSSGMQLVGFAGSESGLRAGASAMAQVDESAVVIALAG